VTEVTARAVAKHAGISERTVFRYYASREQFLDAVAAEAERSLGAPAPPASIDELRGYARVLYTRFEEKAALVKSALHTELFKRMREGAGRVRWQAVRALIDAHARHRSARDRKIAAANIRYYLAASTWHYYRFYFEFTLAETIDCAERAVQLALDDIARR
jgi:AcrR family transcriptional regulator